MPGGHAKRSSDLLASLGAYFDPALATSRPYVSHDHDLPIAGRSTVPVAILVAFIWAAGTAGLTLNITARMSPGAFLCGMFTAALWGYAAWHTRRSGEWPVILTWIAVALAVMVELRAGAYGVHLGLAALLNAVPAVVGMIWPPRASRPVLAPAPRWLATASPALSA